MKFLVIQTAFIGDVILATSVVERLHLLYADAKIDFMLRKGNESLLEGHPFINKLIIWDKKKNKYANYIKIIKQVRKNNYDYVINIHRFISTGLITVLSGAKFKIGFNKNPLSFLFNIRVKHLIGDNVNQIHEADRNLSLIEEIIDKKLLEDNLPKPAHSSILTFHSSLVRLYPSKEDYTFTKQYKNSPYICVAPASVWFSKQYPQDKWIDFIIQTQNYAIYLLGANNDFNLCQNIITKSTALLLSNLQSPISILNLAGKLTFLQTAALMKDAKMNYVNDSAPLHIASCVNAPVTAIFCSTVPAFGFGPLSANSFVVEVKEKLYCRPCGLHGFNKCPEKHFRCAYNIKTEQLIETLK